MPRRRPDRRSEVLSYLTTELPDGKLIDEGVAMLSKLGEHWGDEDPKHPRARARAGDRLVAHHPQRIHGGYTTRGRALRVQRLPENTPFDRDVEAARESLGLPVLDLSLSSVEADWSGYIEGATPEEKAYIGELPGTETVELPAGSLAGAWLLAHHLAWEGEPERPKHLPEDLYRLAVISARVDLTEESVPYWMRSAPEASAPLHERSDATDCSPERPQKGATGRPLVPTMSPVPWAAFWLAYRHRLPIHLRPSIEAYLLTSDRSYLKSGQPLEFYSRRGTGAVESPFAFDVTVQSVDEFTTEAEWKWIWTNFVEPKRDQLRADRGKEPTGGWGLKSERIEKYFPVYTRRRSEGLTFNEAFAKWSKDPELSLLLGDADRATIRNADRDISHIFNPVEFGPCSDLFNDHQVPQGEDKAGR